MPKCSRTIIAFDFGLARIGVAVGQELIASARPLTILRNKRQRPDWDAIGRLLTEWQADLLLVGIPHHADNSPSALTDAAQRFSRRLQGRYGLPVETIDEHLSSWEADSYQASCGKSPQDDHNDAFAATLILESWLNHALAVTHTSKR
ncbi:MAG: Holliday junction resolvase RuvX [Candidatus Competibacteraceae bacterium]|nr:Holliday junction resolvase RuvX [Candidatus Competibacteraceae bacterium]